MLLLLLSLGTSDCYCVSVTINKWACVLLYSGCSEFLQGGDAQPCGEGGVGRGPSVGVLRERQNEELKLWQMLKLWHR